MKRRHRSLLFVVVTLLAMASITSFILFEFRRSVSFFCTPSELLSDEKASTRFVRVGGMVVKGSIKYDGEVVNFSITDQNTELKVTYTGIPPPLFGEGMGAIAKGHLVGKTFVAEELLAKHDERYMPKKYAIQSSENSNTSYQRR